jgi:hypothetical protein
MYVKITNGSVDTYPYSVGQLRRDNPNTSFPKQVPDEMLEEYGVYSVTTESPPSFDIRTQKITENDTPTLIDGTWTIGWTTTSKTSDEVTTYDNEVAVNNRVTRNKLLADSDWTQMNDSPLSNEAKTLWATYRQELRGITDLDAWPNLADEDWPVAP